MAAAEEGLDVAYDVPEGRKFVKRHLIAIGMTLLMLVLGAMGDVPPGVRPAARIQTVHRARHMF
jgi:hypothetical protein